MDTAQVTLLTCYYVQQYYQPNHQESIGEKEKCEVGVDELICMENRLLAELLSCTAIDSMDSMDSRGAVYFFSPGGGLGVHFHCLQGGWGLGMTPPPLVG